MSASTTVLPGQASETKVCPSFGPALKGLGVKAKAKIKKEAAEDAARILKATFRFDIPIEPVGLAEELDIRVLELQLEDDKLGMLLIKPGDEPKIYLNRQHGILRQRMTCAFELGQYVRHSAKTNKYGHVARRTDRLTLKDDPDLVYAEEFASCLLMPKRELRVLAELGVDDLEIALRFQVPREALQLRLNEIGFRTAELSEA
jgi:Zn-dependent peptidase ImmA (M78 family)